MPLLVTLVVYFGIRLGHLEDGKPLKGGKMCCHQYWKWELILVNSQNKLVQCKLLDYILDMLPRIVIWNRGC